MSRRNDALLRQPLINSVLGGIVFLLVPVVKGLSDGAIIIFLILAFTFSLMSFALGSLPWWHFEIGLLKDRIVPEWVLVIFDVYSLIASATAAFFLLWPAPALKSFFDLVISGTGRIDIGSLFSVGILVLADLIACIIIILCIRRMVRRRRVGLERDLLIKGE